MVKLYDTSGFGYIETEVADLFRARHAHRQYTD